MGAMKFRKDSPEEVCPKVIMGDAANPHRWEEFGGLACMRIAGHEGECESMAATAAEADGVCHGCRNPLTGPCKPDCHAVKP